MQQSMGVVHGYPPWNAAEAAPDKRRNRGRQIPADIAAQKTETAETAQSRRDRYGLKAVAPTGVPDEELLQRVR